MFVCVELILLTFDFIFFYINALFLEKGIANGHSFPEFFFFLHSVEHLYAQTALLAPLFHSCRELIYLHFLVNMSGADFAAASRPARLRFPDLHFAILVKRLYTGTQRKTVLLLDQERKQRQTLLALRGCYKARRKETCNTFKVKTARTR
jgi:hypothetical protein